jgi:hypothetical protein
MNTLHAIIRARLDRPVAHCRTWDRLHRPPNRADPLNWTGSVWWRRRAAARLAEWPPLPAPSPTRRQRH